MALNPIGDIARTLIAQQQTHALKEQQTIYTKQLTTGIVDDAASHLGGDVAFFASLSRAQELQSQYITTNKESAEMASVMQSALKNIMASSNDLTETLIVIPQSGLLGFAGVARQQAEATLGTIVSALNSQFAGRSLFSGTDVNGASIAGIDEILDQVDMAISGLTTASDVITAIDGFMAPGAGYDTQIYLGNAQDVESTRIDDNETVSLALRADNQSLKSAVASVLFAYAADNSALDIQEQRELLEHARSGVLTSTEAVLSEATRIGFAEERIESANTRLQTSVLENEKSKIALLQVDAFEAATRLEDVNARLEYIYATTARAARLSFLDYM